MAERAAAAYAGNGKLAALAVAGSVGAGLADRFSDLELDCYWPSPPGDRTGPISGLGGGGTTTRATGSGARTTCWAAWA